MSVVPTTPATQPNQQTPGVFKTFRALRHRDFRLLWIGLAVSAVGTWMQIVAQSLLVLKITHGSAFALGTVSLAQALAFFLFALVGGSVADRLDKRRLLLFTQTGSATLAILLGFLTLFGVIQLWMILVLAFLNGTLLSFDQPARGALVPVLVPQESLGNAISLQAMTFNGAATLGPALAGFGVATLGYAGNFFLNGASFLGVLIALYVMRVPKGPTHQLSTLQAIRDALGTVRRDAVLPWVLSGYAAMLFLGPSSALILPVYAVKILHIGPERLGLLFSAAGVGTILGALFLASLDSNPRRGRIFLTGIFIWVVALTGFAITSRFWIAMAALLIFGVGQTLAGTTTITLLQTRAPQQMRGRLMSLNTLLIMGVRPLGDFPAGALIAGIGAPGTVLLSASLVGIYGLGLAMRPAIRST
ncbi:MAG: MFS transporter [Candidatus Korobacteraceae bacterium]|jgi:MFS family permease